MSDGTDGMKKPPEPIPGKKLHQRRSLRKSPTGMAIGGFLIVATIGYFTLYTKSKPGNSPAKVTAGDPPK